MIKIGMTDGRNSCAVQVTTKALHDQLSCLRGFSDLNDVQRAGIYILCHQMSQVCHGESPDKFQNLAYVLGVTDSEDIKKILMESMNDI